MITVRRATLADKPRIFEFLRAAYPARWEHILPERWEWEYEKSPFSSEAGLPVFVAVEEDSGRVVGQACAMRVRLKVGAELREAAWGTDIIVLPEHRGGLGIRLQQVNQAANAVLLALNMSDVMRAIKLRFGAVPLPPVRIFDKLLTYRPERVAAVLLDRLAPRDGRWRRAAAALVRRLLAPAFTFALNHRLSWREAARTPPDADVTLTPIAAFGAEADELWRRLSDHFEVAVVRDAEYLNWKFVHQPHMNYERFLVRRGGEVVGYLVLRQGRPPEANTGYVIDLAIPPDDRPAIRAALRFAVRHFRERGAPNVEAATTVAAYQGALRELGFAEAGESVPTCRCHPGGADPESLRRAEWMLSKGDCDWDQYPMPR